MSGNGKQPRPADVCPKCGGLGLVKLDVPPDHPNFGQFRPCPGQAHAQERQERLYQLSGLKPRERYALDDILALDASSERLIEVVSKFLNEPRGWLYLYGGPGNGKTLALMASVSEMVRRGVPALYVTMADLLDLMRETFSNKPSAGRDTGAGEDQWRRWDTYQARFRRVQTVQFLAVDEFDGSKINETAFVHEFRARLVDHRYRAAIAGETVTMFAGNDDPALLPTWIYDRVRDGRFRLFENAGQSVRPEMEWSD